MYVKATMHRSYSPPYPLHPTPSIPPPLMQITSISCIFRSAWVILYEFTHREGRINGERETDDLHRGAVENIASCIPRTRKDRSMLKCGFSTRIYKGSRVRANNDECATGRDVKCSPSSFSCGSLGHRQAAFLVCLYSFIYLIFYFVVVLIYKWVFVATIQHHLYNFAF